MEREPNEIHRNLFRTLRNEITDSDFNKIKRELTEAKFGHFGAGEIQREMKTVDDFLQKLKKKGLLKIGDYRILTKLFIVTDNQDLVEHVRRVEFRLMDIDYPVKRSDDNSANTIPVGVQMGPSHGHPGPHYDRHQPTRPLACSSDGYHGYSQQPARAPQPEPRYEGVASSASQADGLTQYFDHTILYEPGRSYVLFINNMFTRQQNARRGAEIDEGNVQDLFRNCLSHHDLHYHTDVYKDELFKYLEGVKEQLAKDQYKSFTLIIGSHGEPKMEDGVEKDAVMMAGSELVTVDEIVSNFHGDQCKAMKDKPKIFIIQSCRGKRMRRGTSLSDDPAEGVGPNTTPKRSILTRPVNSDILIAHATSIGTQAWRNEGEGSWFVKDLCDVIRKFYNKEHILDILVRVNYKMVDRESTEGGAKQMPCFWCTFTKRFYFQLPSK